MAASGFTPISLYHSSTASAVPLNTNLVNGELAINITDGRLYYKDNAGVVRLLASNAGSSPVTSFSAGTTGLTPSTATTGAVTLSGTLAIANGGTGSTATAYCSLTTNVSGTLPVANGGTSRTSLTANNVILGNGTSAVNFVAPGTTGNVLTSDGTTWTSAAAGGGGGAQGFVTMFTGGNTPPTQNSDGFGII